MKLNILKIINPENLKKAFIFQAVIFASMLVIALFYQFYFDEEPCPLCVLIRLVVVANLIVSLLMLSMPGKISCMIGLSCLSMLSFSGSDIAMELYKIETGEIIASCGFAAPFPSWFPIHELAPFMFNPTGLCGGVVELSTHFLIASTVLLIWFTDTLFNCKTATESLYALIHSVFVYVITYIIYASGLVESHSFSMNEALFLMFGVYKTIIVSSTGFYAGVLAIALLNRAKPQNQVNK
ncbi:disulfide bond formation protein B [Psychromonas sp. SP041]|uniref:disulfide bond formation protein B n=1 Tax=Psychromonas sp. SP041 TaxID=1365007 RepID=UPI0010C7AC73|nr:disulfide bond formation protein B [Psychromonas sp. SP041]